MNEVWAIRAEMGVDKAIAAADPFWERGDAIFKHMMGMPVHTIEGAAVLARAT